MTLVTKRDLVKLSSPACHPRYEMRIPAGARCKLVSGLPVVDDTTKVQGGNEHDLRHYYIWLEHSDVEERQ